MVTQIAQNLGELIEKKVLACKMYCRWVTHSYMHVFIYTYTIYIYYELKLLSCFLFAYCSRFR